MLRCRALSAEPRLAASSRAARCAAPATALARSCSSAASPPRLASLSPPKTREPLRRVACASSSTATPELSSNTPPPQASAPVLPALAAASLIAAVVAVRWLYPGAGVAVVDSLARSGVTAAFGLIFVSEIGDKTFFIAALLAMKRGRAVVLAGAVAALALMTGVSVAIGRLFSKLPDSFSSTLPLGEYAAAAALFFFGVKALRDASRLPPAGAPTEELDAAAEVIAAAEESEGQKAPRGRGDWAAGFLQAFLLIFVAEWGDRSMLATIALGAAQNPGGVFVGAVGGHALATLIAVIGGSLLSSRISERAVGFTGGVLFLLFSAATLMGVF